ncbi:MAG TPA: phosphopantetheine-binding protein [Povalibacter sp.]|nr:phosphopantetheine-binding protein [Povalibacter sp.]
MDHLDRIKDILRDALQLGERADSFTADTALLGSIPEFDSMAVVSVLTMLEEQFGITVADDEISADTFQTVGALAAFVSQKVDA